jgi:hypothetical protein
VHSPPSPPYKEASDDPFAVKKLHQKSSPPDLPMKLNLSKNAHRVRSAMEQAAVRLLIIVANSILKTFAHVQQTLASYRIKTNEAPKYWAKFQIFLML